MIQADMHMHTWFSTDSEACPCDMADEAVRKGLKTICFTDHFDVDFPNAHNLDFEVDIPTYREDVHFVQEQFADKLAVKWGIEVGIQQDDRILAETNRRLAGWDYPDCPGCLDCPGYLVGCRRK